EKVNNSHNQTNQSDKINQDYANTLLQLLNTKLSSLFTFIVDNININRETFLSSINTVNTMNAVNTINTVDIMQYDILKRDNKNNIDNNIDIIKLNECDYKMNKYKHQLSECKHKMDEYKQKINEYAEQIHNMNCIINTDAAQREREKRISIRTDIESDVKSD